MININKFIVILKSDLKKIVSINIENKKWLKKLKKNNQVLK